ncbi:DUF418 domain-containing protein [Bordetella sp. BOR01]|uniref:DUF418 domain-containing protein n=1 Tax=Bordetella sp. BOR01 TaxID=2854779 RepID=UPI001C463BED|nr:DUF418 domain-containing protein [Bordetella sp. BOR01]MBV7485623.1 DUF418 domain-containing protein [Bordetella sp. BOR01]
MPGIPATDARRLHDVDALRGFALLGILVVNIGVFASPYYGSSLTDPVFDRPLDHAVRWLVAFLFETKFYLLFSFLFGYSFTLQMAAAERAQAAFVPRFGRRVAGLAVLGLLHGLLLFQGDILLTYAVLGLVLLRWRDLAARRALRRAVLLVLACAGAWLLLGLLVAMTPTDTADAAGTAWQHAEIAAALAAYRGTIATTIAQHSLELRTTMLFALLTVQGPCALAMFLVGLAAGRHCALADTTAHAGLLRRLVWIGLPVGMAGAGLYATLSLLPMALDLSVLGLGIGLLTAPFLTAAYAAALLLALQTGRAAALGAALAPAGRMALSNYLLQSLVCAIVFKAYGGRLMGQLSPLAVLAIAAMLYAAQLALSAAWLRRHRYGPVEWALRALTYLQWPAWRTSAPNSPPG